MTTPTDICAEVTGTLWRILVQPQEPLLAGTAVAIIESMKMEIPIDAPTAGRVVEFLVAEGEAIEDGAVIARFVAD